MPFSRCRLRHLALVIYTRILPSVSVLNLDMGPLQSFDKNIYPRRSSLHTNRHRSLDLIFRGRCLLMYDGGGA